MIEKIDLKSNLRNLPNSETRFACAALKINELVDAVNEILAVQEQYETIYNEDIVPMLTPQNKEPADQYAEQKE